MGKLSLSILAQEHLEIALKASSGRSAHTVYGGHDSHLRQTMIALAGGRILDEHESPAEATIHVLQGRIRLTTGADTRDGAAGDLIIVASSGLQTVEAIENSAVLLTVATPQAA